MNAVGRADAVGMILSDVGYVWGAAQGMGGWSEMARLGEWTKEDWLVNILTWPFVLCRVWVVLFARDGQATKKRI